MIPFDKIIIHSVFFDYHHTQASIRYSYEGKEYMKHFTFMQLEKSNAYNNTNMQLLLAASIHPSQGTIPDITIGKR